MENIFAVLLGIINYIKALVKYFRDTNDGKDATMPDFSEIFAALSGGEEAPAEEG